MQSNPRNRAALLEQWERWLEVPMFCLVIVMIVTLLVPLVTPLSNATYQILEIVDWFIWAIFFLELAFRTFLAEKKFAYLQKNWIDLLIVLLPVLRVFRIFRLIRVLRILRFARVFIFFGKFTQEVKIFLIRHHFHYLAIIICVLVTIGGVLIYNFDKEFAGEDRTFSAALWLSVVNAFSGGYANTYPLGIEAKAVSIVLILFGTVLVSYFTASLASYFTEKEQDVEQERIEKKLDRLLEEVQELKKK